MTDARLKQTERSEVYHLISWAGFDPTEFTWKEKRDHESFRSNMGGGDQVAVSILRHNPTEYYMRFGAFANEFSRAVNTRVDHDKHDGTWKTRVRSCATWLKELRKEVDVSDVWGTVGGERILAGAVAAAGLDNNPFTTAERRHISHALNEIKSTLTSMRQFDERQAAIIDNQFRYLDDSANRLGRKDWLMLSLGALVTVIVALSLTQEQGNGLLRLALLLLHQVWDGVLSLAP